LTRDPADRLHLFAEIMRRGFAARAARLGDPDFSPIELTRPLFDPEFARRSMDDFSWTKASMSTLENFTWRTEGEHTTHLSVVDPDGNAVALTYTLEDVYGSAIVCRGGGFLLNNEMGDFNPRPGLTTKDGLIGSRPNLVAPRKRMLSSMTPTIVSNASGVRYVLGTPGGRTIINTVFQLTANLIDFDWTIARATAFPRIHHQWMPDVLRVERSLADDPVIASLKARGHTVEFVASIGAAECIAIKRSNRAEAPITLEPGVDPRAPDGGAATYLRPSKR
jgi:gamma-glutamyltranspeptidase/glutathione hydrolase